jgi:hypothetical protein
MIWLAILGAAVASMWGRMAAAENVSMNVSLSEGA